jgi:hypothetical protein
MPWDLQEENASVSGHRMGMRVNVVIQIPRCPRGCSYE